MFKAIVITKAFPVLSCIPQVLLPSCPASFLSCFPPVLLPSSPASLLSCLPYLLHPVLHPSGPISLLSSSHLLSCILPSFSILPAFCPFCLAYFLFFIHPVLPKAALLPLSYSLPPFCPTSFWFCQSLELPFLCLQHPSFPICNCIRPFVNDPVLHTSCSPYI